MTKMILASDQAVTTQEPPNTVNLSEALRRMRPRLTHPSWSRLSSLAMASAIPETNSP